MSNANQIVIDKLKEMRKTGEPVWVTFKEDATILLATEAAAVLARCEWGRDDYSLNVKTVMGDEPGPDPNVQDLPLFAATRKGGDA